MYFSISGVYQPVPNVEFRYTRDSETKTARYIIISIPHVIGQYAKFEFYFDDRWLLLSEIHFVSGKWRRKQSTQIQFCC